MMEKMKKLKWKFEKDLSSTSLELEKEEVKKIYKNKVRLGVPPKAKQHRLR